MNNHKKLKNIDRAIDRYISFTLLKSQQIYSLKGSSLSLPSISLFKYDDDGDEKKKN